jgi:ABC-type phosphonate transport system ATPase subunit
MKAGAGIKIGNKIGVGVKARIGKRTGVSAGARIGKRRIAAGAGVKI